MKILLDECVDRRLAKAITNHVVRTVPQEGWQSFKNGELLRAAQAKFDVFITVDRNLYFQQALHKLDLTVIVLCGPSNRLADLLPLVPKALKKIKSRNQGAIHFIK